MYHAPVRALILGAVVLAACGDEGPRLRLAPIHAGDCGRPANGRTLLVTPLGDFVGERQAIPLDRVTTLPSLPDGTRGLAVEVLDASARALAIGRTAPLELDALADGDTIPIAMVPPDGLCPAGALTEPRDRAAVVRVGDGVLVVGGSATASAERYDPATESTSALALPPAFTGPLGVIGAGVAALPDGRAVVIGGVRPGFTIYTPGQGFGAATLLAETRAHHVTLALDDRRVLLAAGCSVVDVDGACEGGNLRRDTRVVDLLTGEVVAGPPLAIGRRDGVGVLEFGVDGRRFALLTGGTDAAGLAVTTGERIALDGGMPTALPGTGAALAQLDSGATLTAFAPVDTAAVTTAAVIVPGDAAPRALPLPMPRVGAVLVTQDDGAVLALGGGLPLRYTPSQHRWDTLGDPGVTLGGAPAALRWDDGTVLVFGGRDGASATAAVWRFRPRLLGPLTGAIDVVPGDGASEPPLAPLDPAAIVRSPGWTLPADAASWAIVGGPTAGTARLDLALTVPAAGVDVLTGWLGVTDHDRLVLVPGQAAQFDRVRDGGRTTLCRGATVPAAGAQDLVIELATSSVRVVVSAAVVLSCAVDDRRRGQVGVAARGAPVTVAAIAVSR